VKLYLGYPLSANLSFYLLTDLLNYIVTYLFR